MSQQIAVRQRVRMQVRPWMVLEGDLLVGKDTLCEGVTERINPRIGGETSWNIWYTNAEGKPRMMIRFANDLVEVLR